MEKNIIIEGYSLDAIKIFLEILEKAPLKNDESTEKERIAYFCLVRVSGRQGMEKNEKVSRSNANLLIGDITTLLRICGYPYKIQGQS